MTTYKLEPANFSDYREFLKKRFFDLNQKNRRFSLGACARKSKISKSLLQFVFQKKRHMSLDRMVSLAKTLKLTSEEEYFTYLMICKNSSRNPFVQKHFEEVLARIRHEYIKSDESPLLTSTSDDKKLYQNYLFMILQALVRLKGFDENINWILENIKIPHLNKEKLMQVLRELERLGFIFRNKENKLIAKPEALWRPDPYDPTGQMVYTKAAEGMAELMQKPSLYKPAVYSSMTLSLDEENLLKAEKIMIDVHHKLTKLASLSVEPTAVVQVANFLLTVVRLKSL